VVVESPGPTVRHRDEGADITVPIPDVDQTVPLGEPATAPPLLDR